MSSAYPRLTLKRGRAKPLWHGHPWVYAQAVHRLDEVEPGGLVDICDDQGAFIGRGSVHPGSSIVARMLSRDRAEQLDRSWLRRRLERAIELRRQLGLPDGDTDCYRVVNSEGDGLSGVIVDAYGPALAVQFNSLHMFQRADEIYEELRACLEPELIVRSRVGRFAEQEGFGAAPGVIDDPGRDAVDVACKENGLRLRVDLLAGQKTGLYLDQRDNHALVGRLSAGVGRVLDLYSYRGGFALHAARGGAGEVVAVDSSARAIEAVRDNAARNDLRNIEAAESDVFRWLQAAPPGGVDLVIVDPPSFTHSRRQLDAALKGYRKLHRLALAAVGSGGLLCSACCSQLISAQQHLRALAAAATELGREVRLLYRRGAGPDHPRPPAFDEGDYLSFVVCLVE